MNEIRNDPEELKTGETRGAERQSLDDATLNPRAYVEQTGDYQQAEAIQNTLTSIVDNASKSAGEADSLPLPLPRPAEQDLSENKSASRDNLDATPQPIPDVAQDVGATPLPIPKPEDGSLPKVRGDLDQLTPMEQSNQFDATPIPLPGQEGLASQQADVRDDLNQATTGDNESDRNEATPINLPGPQAAAGISDKTPDMDSLSKYEALPLDGDVQVSRRFSWEVPNSLAEKADIEEPTRGVANLREASQTLRELTTEAADHSISASGDQEAQIYHQSLVGAADQMEQLASQWEEALTAEKINPETLANVSALADEVQLKLQMAMDKKSQSEQILSEILKAFSNTQRDLIANLK